MLYTIALEVQFERQDKHPAAILGKLKASFFSFCKFLHIKSESKKQPSRKEQKKYDKDVRIQSCICCICNHT
jgi:hypothetical protein